MANYHDTATRWRDIVLGVTNKAPLKNDRMPVYGDRIYSYGRHFELARPLRDKKGKALGFLLNGDRYSVTTNKHQAEIRSALKDYDHAIIPHSVLIASGIDLDSIRILHATSDRNERICHTSRNRGDFSPNAYEDRYPAPDGFPSWPGAYTFDGEIYRWVTNRHWLGESLIEADVPYVVKCRHYTPGTHTAPHPNDVAPRPEPYWQLPYEEREAWEAAWGKARKAWNRSYVPQSCTKHPHGMCDGVIRKRRRAKFLSGFDHNERRPSYFFCELPATDASTVEEAYAALKPETVRLAESLGREVKRQGDIFAIPTEVNRRALRAAGATFDKSARIFSTNHVATEIATLPNGVTLARGTLRHRPEHRDPDHARVSLGDTFHVLVKNTVPLAA